MLDNIYKSLLKSYGEMTDYNFNLIMKDYAKFPKYLPVPFHMEHGWTALDEPLVSDLRTRKKLMLVFSKRRELAWKSKSNIPVYIMGAPFVHYRRMHKIERNPEAKGTIAFPAHSGTFVKSVFDIEKYCKQLNSLDDEFKPITISLHYDDIRRGMDKVFSKYGFNIVSAGNRNDINFPEKFYNILKNHKYATGNDVGSAAFYCVEMGIPYFILGNIAYEENDGRDINVALKNSIMDHIYGRKAYEIFNTGPTKSISKNQKEFVNSELGIDDCLSPMEINNMFRKVFSLKEIPLRILERPLRRFKKNFKVYKIIQYNIKKRRIQNFGTNHKLIPPQKFINKIHKKTNYFYFSNSSQVSNLYNIVYAILLKAILGNVNQLSAKEKKNWVNFINNFQHEDGLFRDRTIENAKTSIIDWWGWRHLSAHVVTALHAFEEKTKYPFKFVEFLYNEGNTKKWLESLNWTYDSSNTSNAVMNYGVCLQYNRDFWNIEESSHSLEEMFEFLDDIQDKKTGLWGGPHNYSQNSLSQMEQTAYHLWMLYFYDRRKINHVEKAIDSCLALQNDLGGFGPGYKMSKVSNPFTSACEDIDCIDPLSRFYFLTDYRKKDIEISLRKAIPWVLYNQNKDGGFVFRRDEKFVYSHKFMSSKKNESNMFATWFRTLSLAYISKVLPQEHNLKNVKFILRINCPGYQFWNL